MPSPHPSPDQASFLAEMVGRRLLIETGTPGVYGRGGDFERIRLGVSSLITRLAAEENPEHMSFPPILARKALETVGYLKSFPHLAGTIFSFEGTEAEASEQQAHAHAHEDWSGFQSMTDLVLTPAACYPVYPAIAARGPLEQGAITVDAGGAYVFRREPSGDPARLQMFHQREIVRIGEPQLVQQWRDAWRERAAGLLGGLGLKVEVEVASDPFFGRSGRMLAASQREQQLKFEITTHITEPDVTAVASFNYHETHFAAAFGILLSDGSPAHTACLGFGLERVTLALLRCHGLEPDRWPRDVREQLWEK